MKIVVLNGGISTERDVSLVSGTQIYKALKGKGYDAVLLDVFLGYEKELSDSEIPELFTADIDWAERAAKVSATAPDIEAVKASRRKKTDELFGENVIRICRAADIVFMAFLSPCFLSFVPGCNHQSKHKYSYNRAYKHERYCVHPCHRIASFVIRAYHAYCVQSDMLLAKAFPQAVFSPLMRKF